MLVDKPAGPSSFAVVADLRRRYGTKAGHAGTLDPLATGLLLVLLGRGTRLARYLVGLDKRYRTEIRLGLRTSTGDGEGEVVEETPIVSEAEIAALEGEVELPVPAASAVKIGGERAYKLHRQGMAVEMPLRASTIHGLEIVRYAPPLVELDLHVSSGTYVRAIADALGGHCRWLRRTAVGPFRVEDADDGARPASCSPRSSTCRSARSTGRKDPPSSARAAPCPGRGRGRSRSGPGTVSSLPSGRPAEER